MELNWMRPRSKGDSTTVGYRKVTYFAHLINIILSIASIISKQILSTLMGYRKQIATVNRVPHRKIALEEEADPHSRMLAEEEDHSDHSHTAELGHTHIQVVGVGRHLAEDTVQLDQPEDLAATAVFAHKFVARDGD